MGDVVTPRDVFREAIQEYADAVLAACGCDVQAASALLARHLREDAGDAATYIADAVSEEHDGRYR